MDILVRTILFYSRTINCQLSTVNRQLSTINRQLSTVNIKNVLSIFPGIYIFVTKLNYKLRIKDYPKVQSGILL